jgi:hypothetical protein
MKMHLGTYRRNGLMLKTKSLDDLFSLLEEMTQSKFKYPKLAPPPIMQCFQKYSIRGFLFTSLLFLVLAVVQVIRQHLGITSPPGFYLAALILILILQAFGIVYVMTVVATAWWDGKQHFPAMLIALKKDLHSDEKFITRLWTFDKETLAYGLLQYRHRWAFAEGRVVAMAGNMQKLGLVPAMAALLISAATFLRENNNAFVWATVIITAFLYLVALYVLDSLERPKQVIRLLEYAIQHEDKLPIPNH